jgi:hypothetical protein
MLVEVIDRNLTYTPSCTESSIRGSDSLQAYTDVTGDTGQISRGQSGGGVNEGKLRLYI